MLPKAFCLLALACFTSTMPTTRGKCRHHDADVLPVPLRIMPLGASITQGFQSSSKNGYRKQLREKLTETTQVNMVGSKRDGSMLDNDNEGWPGYVISQVQDKAEKSVPKWKPNLVLINAGTNDCFHDLDLDNSGARMEDLIDSVQADASPGVVIVLSTLIINRNQTVEKRVKEVNDKFRQLVLKYQADGQKVVLAEMHGDDGPTSDDMADDTHPNDRGYEMMAHIWYDAISDVISKGWLKRAEDIGIPEDGNEGR